MKLLEHWIVFAGSDKDTQCGYMVLAESKTDAKEKFRIQWQKQAETMRIFSIEKATTEDLEGLQKISEEMKL